MSKKADLKINLGTSKDVVETEEIKIDLDGSDFIIKVKVDKTSLRKARMYLAQINKGKMSEDDMMKALISNFDVLYNFFSILIENVDETMNLILELIDLDMEEQAKKIADLIGKKLNQTAK